MTIIKLLKILSVPMLLGVGGTAVAVQASQTVADPEAPLACEISAKTHGRALSIHGVVTAMEPLEGAYQLKVKSVGGANRTNIVQGGAFATDDDGEAELGNVTLGGSGASYSVELVVEAGQLDAKCSQIVDLRA